MSAEYFPAKGLEQLLQTVAKVRRQINPKLQIDGILLAMADNRTNFAKEIASLIRDTYGSKIKVFSSEIPHSVRAKEASAEGKSIWETYSAFANTYGGIILLGVEEWADKSLHTVDLPDTEKLIKKFWDIVNNTNKASVNVLSSKDVFVQNVDGDHIVVINVPRAERSYRPVYVDGNPFCTYRRNGEGDYRCTKKEYQAMVRDASVKTQDMLNGYCPPQDFLCSATSTILCVNSMPIF